MFVPVTAPDQIETVARLARAIWSEHYFPIIGKKQTDYMVENFQSADAVSRQIQDEAHLYFLIAPAGEHIGYFAIQSRPDELFLSKIYVEQSARRQGFGRKALDFIEEQALELGKPVITLTVNRHNSGSIAAYSRFGFRIVDECVTDIGDGFVMDDYIMQKEVSAAR
jgi:ribosomal protein S18 acetylase RimI-like enzyme